MIHHLPSSTKRRNFRTSSGEEKYYRCDRWHKTAKEPATATTLQLVSTGLETVSIGRLFRQSIIPSSKLSSKLIFRIFVVDRNEIDTFHQSNNTNRDQFINVTKAWMDIIDHVCSSTNISVDSVSIDWMHSSRSNHHPIVSHRAATSLARYGTIRTRTRQWFAHGFGRSNAFTSRKKKIRIRPRFLQGFSNCRRKWFSSHSDNIVINLRVFGTWLLLVVVYWL